MNTAMETNTRYFFTGVDEIDYAQEPDVLLALACRRDEVFALLDKRSNRIERLIDAMFGPVFDNLMEHHDYWEADKIRDRELDKAIRAEHKRYKKKALAVYRKYEPVINAGR